MRYVTRREMQDIDRRATEEHGIPVDVLMENAGRAVADAVEERASKACPVVAVCGKGNNGGDGFVAARLLAGRGFEVEILALQDSYDESTATGRNWAKVRDSLDFVGRFKRRPMAVILDAIFGTGLARPVAGREKALIEEMNRFDPRWFPIVAVDIPSGLDADTGKPLGAAVRATVTVTLGLPKAGFRSPAAREFLGELVVADIGFPPALLRG
jgi:ADP-dependent NAD(P)H-hydrate dehydratase / NAD(P)H-hydrate epimerase